LANGHRRCSVLAQSTRMPTRFACGHSTNQLLKVRSSNRQPQKGVGWGPIARWWSPRKERQGSYDDAWLKDFKANFCADYPQDFNNSYFNCAPPDQMLKGSLQGDEHIELVGVFADKQTVSVQLPGWKLNANSYDHDDQALQGQMRLDTLHVDLDKGQLHATWRLTLDHTQKIHTCVIDLETRP
jgi:hypothetical protein